VRGHMMRFLEIELVTRPKVTTVKPGGIFTVFPVDAQVYTGALCHDSSVPTL
jgi:hypothetical protein